MNRFEAGILLLESIHCENLLVGSIYIYPTGCGGGGGEFGFRWVPRDSDPMTIECRHHAVIGAERLLKCPNGTGLAYALRLLRKPLGWRRPCDDACTNKKNRLQWKKQQNLRSACVRLPRFLPALLRQHILLPFRLVTTPFHCTRRRLHSVSL